MNTRRYVDGQLVAGRPPAGGAPVVLQLSSTSDLRSFLLAQMQAVVDGKLDHDAVRSVCALAEQVYKSAKLELDFANMLGRPSPAPVNLTDDD